jgi:tetratricopeptide (TPR) repeat protein
VVANQVEKAKEVLNEGLKASPKNPSLHHLSAQILGQQERYGEAISHLETAIANWAYYRDDAVTLDDLHYTLAGALVMTGRFDEGLSHLKRALEINPRNFMVLNDLGLVHEQLGQKEEAVKYYQQALAIEPSFTPAAENLKRIQGINGIS